MATKSSNESKPSVASLMLVVIIFGSLLVLFLVPTPLFTSVRDSEQKQLITWLGAEPDQWIMAQIFGLLEWINHSISNAFDTAELSGNEKIDRWLMERAFAGTVWAHVVLYRSGMLMMWGLFAFPCILAALLDGHYRRQIAKASFTSQSPMLHKRGVDMAKLCGISLVAWIFVPIYVSTWVAPLAIVGLSFAWWLWIANLQKRL